LFDLIFPLLRRAAELHATQLRDQQLQVFDLRIARSQLFALRKDFFLLCGELFPMREDLLMQCQDDGLQCFGIELIEIRKCGGIHCREHSAVLLQRDENTSEK